MAEQQACRDGAAQKTNAPKSIKRKTAGAENSGQDMLRCKRRISFQNLGYSLPQANPVSVHRRNERERNRVKLVNMGFTTLREHVPNGAKNKKMSKVDTLKSAIAYIGELQRLLEDYHGYDPALTAQAVAAFASAQRHVMENLNAAAAGAYSPDSSSYLPASTPSPTDYSVSSMSPATYADASPSAYTSGSPTAGYTTSAAPTYQSTSPHGYHYNQYQQHDGVCYGQPTDIGHHHGGGAGSGGGGGTLSTGSPSPSYLSDNSTGDAPVSPKDVLELASWYGSIS
ncbi:PREDICTED: achaete-scute homolog 1-like [Priapulus caudatus]|uniref:Achaete-scute homolog 1-like n=1 Tax=Priapulus caudatus TaxID=37621 RepID=A0ABM1ER27_PRICU|nr:PREDICTED: achaete-scute homolog 1-like [Priapulus caudatus]